MSEGQDAIQKAQGSRLRESRLNAGFEAVEEALAACKRHSLDVGLSTYYQYESGERKYLKHAQKFAECYGVQPEFLLYGAIPKKHRVAVRGSIGADGIVLTTRGRTTDTVEAPPGENPAALVAFRVNASAIPGYGNGDVIFYDGAAFNADPTPESLVDRDCIIEDSEGTTSLACVVSVARNGEAVIKRAGKRHRITITCAAPVKWVKKA